MKKEKTIARPGDKLSGRIWFNLFLFNLIGGIAWNLENMYFNTFLYNSVYAGASQAALSGTMAPTTAISRMVALSAVTAVVTARVAARINVRSLDNFIFILL